jgi:hypothetical protein
MAKVSLYPSDQQGLTMQMDQGQRQQAIMLGEG